MLTTPPTNTIKMRAAQTLDGRSASAVLGEVGAAVGQHPHGQGCAARAQAHPEGVDRTHQSRRRRLIQAPRVRIDGECWRAGRREARQPEDRIVLPALPWPLEPLARRATLAAISRTRKGDRRQRSETHHQRTVWLATLRWKQQRDTTSRVQPRRRRRATRPKAGRQPDRTTGFCTSRVTTPTWLADGRHSESRKVADL